MRRAGRLGYGETIAAVSAIVLFVSMFLDWFDVVAHNTSNLLFLVVSTEPAKNAWEALQYIPLALLATVVVTLAATTLRAAGVVPKPSLPTNLAVAILGVVSMLLILYRIIDPPVFRVEPTVTDEGEVEWPVFLALAAAAGIAWGGCVTARRASQAEREPAPSRTRYAPGGDSAG